MNNLLFQLFGALLIIIGFVSANIPNSAVNINIYGETLSTSFEQRVSEAMENTENIINTIKMASRPADTLKLIPTIGDTLSGSISFLVTYETNNMWKDALYKSIGDAVQRSHAEDKLSDIQAILKTISQLFKHLKTKQLNDDDVKSKLHIILFEFMKIVNLFSRDDISFRKYPQITITPFYSIAILYAIFESIRQKYIPYYTTNVLACRIQDQIEEHRYLHVFNRLNDIESKIYNGLTVRSGTAAVRSRDVKPDKFASNVISRNYNPNGYNAESFIECENWYKCEISVVDERECIRDKESIYRYSRASDNCPIGYMELLRHRVETAYDRSKNVLNEHCPNSVRSQRKATGYGWLKIIFTFAKGILLPDGMYCDPAIVNVRFTPCDLYVKLKINGNREYKTKVIEADEVAFYEMYQSTKISKYQSYEMKLKDDDTGSDDTLVRINGEISELIGQQYHRIQFKDNYFDIIVYWRDEYEDEQ